MTDFTESELVMWDKPIKEPSASLNDAEINWGQITLYNYWVRVKFRTNNMDKFLYLYAWK